MEWINRMRKNKKGFTLVEIIVVLVILAILAAFTIPAMLGFIDDARGNALLAEAREVKIAAQAATTEFYGTTDFDNADLQSLAVAGYKTKTGGGTEAVATANIKAASKQMADYLKGDITPSTTATAADKDLTDAYWDITLTDGKVTVVNYTRNGYTVKLDGTTNNATITKLTT